MTNSLGDKMDVNEIAELLGKTILLLNGNRSRPETRRLLKSADYDDEQINTVFAYIADLNLPE